MPTIRVSDEVYNVVIDAVGARSHREQRVVPMREVADHLLAVGYSHNPALDERLVPCPECEGYPPDEGCGVCAGDGHLWDPDLTIAPPRLWGRLGLFTDHSGLGHACPRCPAPRPAAARD